ncbi:uncharacterized protein B0J16DRAFT_145653 [Fusarium flagelliforme]|uniref:uncharacterized protein n=1 Tax=Fusarium flagelliforme TaxID=2675880 RepID=UPI001E8DBDF0|nr:uncharacterized protein B0J16DRAFT_145653 [Fusarium flagelliforme]KAH7186005.1 hypothetical protein B0J16DRAFT_145653 [Fusarium flagelliforme]
MGFAGKPSQACEPCRLKRRKCDQKKPRCSPCTRMDIARCEYRSLRVLKIKDETLKVTEKSRQRNQVVENRSQGPIHDVVEPVTKSVPLPLEATALGYFFFIFSRSGTFAYLPEFSSSLVKDDNVTQALCASALGSMALQHRDDNLSRIARQYYARSLVQTNQLLSQPETAVLDSTLLCVLLLSAFEALSFHTGGDPENWTAHIRGSSQLLLLRGKRQFQSQFGRLLFHHAGVNVLIDSIVHQTPVSPELHQLFEDATSSFPFLDSISKSIMSLLRRIAVISANTKDMTAKEVLRETFELHEQVTIFREDLCEMAPFEVVDTIDGNGRHQEGHNLHTFEGVMHRYQDQQEARLHNVARLINLSLLQSIFSVLKHGSGRENSSEDPDMDYTSLEARDFTTDKVLAESAELVKDILASVPYHLDLLEPQNSIEARYLIWPFTSIVSLDVCPPLARYYIKDRLMALGYKFNMRQAIEVAKMLDERDRVQKCMHIIHMS